MPRNTMLKKLSQVQESARPTLPDGPMPFAVRFAEVSDHVNKNVISGEFDDEVTVDRTNNWADMVTHTD